MSLTARIKAEAAALGFAQAGVLPVGPSLTHSFYEAWLARGYAGEMAYLARHAERKRHLARLAPGARSVILLTLDYHHPAPPPPAEGLWGRVSRYAWGADYHEVIGARLERLAAFIAREAARPVQHWTFVDTAPVMEREFAARAGLGWIGKHGVLIHWRRGSWLFLAELLVDLELDYDAPLPPRKGRKPPAGQAGSLERSEAGAGHVGSPGRGEAAGEAGGDAGRSEAAGGTLPLPPPPLELRESCGSCTACIEACPTGAIVAEKTVDSRRCISYHTIELKGPIPREYRPAIGAWVFGCDICQDVCPWNRRARGEGEAAFAPAPGRALPSLPALLALDEAGFHAQFRGSALRRAKRRGLLRNAAIVLGNRLAQGRAGGHAGGGAARGVGVAAEGAGDAGARAEGVAALQRALGDSEPLLRGAAAWALGRAGGPEAREALRRAAAVERDATVREELRLALADGGD